MYRIDIVYLQIEGVYIGTVHEDNVKIYIYKERESEREMHSSSLVNIQPILRMEPKTKMVIVNHTFLTCIMCYILEPN